MSKAEETDSAARREAEGSPSRRIAGWKKALLALSLVLMASSGGLWGVDHLARVDEKPAAAPTTRPGAGVPGVHGLVAAPKTAELPPPAEEAPEAGADWVPAVFRLGFSFFVGFCIAYALRAFFKVSMVAIGLILLALFGLQYAGVVQVDWSAMGRHYDGVMSWLAGQVAGMKSFVTGYLPSAASASAGLFAGFRRG
jgi:uncharacterized membrane protein (Fun14 family)